MRLTIERLRAGVVAGTLLLLMALAGVLVYAHYRAHGLLRDLPSRLGMDIQKQTDGVTYSQTIKGRTVFTVHAARATQHRNGEAELEDAGIVLYGESNGRSDRIYGKRFHYDQAAGVIRAMGQVQLDLNAPAPGSAEERVRFASGAASGPETGKSDGGMQQPVHVTTSDLVYSQRTGMASTPELLHFAYKGVTGEARGASYNARTGFTVFDHEIRLSGVEDGRAFHVTAEHGELDRAANRLTLRTAVIESPGSAGGAEQIAAGTLVLHPGTGGGVERVEGTEGVALWSGGSTARAPVAELTLGAGNHPEMMRMHGGVQFSHGMEKHGADGGGADGSAAAMVAGSAEETVGHFDQRDELSSLLLERSVVIEVTSRSDRGTRRLTGGQVLLALASAPGTKRTWVRQVTAEGAAELRMLRVVAPGSTDVLAADRLQAKLQLGADGRAELRTVSGSGHVVLHRSAAGVEEVSRAETIDAGFAPGAKRGRSSSAQAGVQLLSTVERGSVTLDRSARAANGMMKSMHGSALEASYDGAAGSTTMTGDAMVAQAADTVRADRIVMANATGDAAAYGGVQATLTRAGEPGRAGGSAPADGASTPEPVHAVAARAKFDQATEVVTLFGEATQVARIWTGASQVEAAVLTLRQREGTLDAFRGEGGAAVNTVLAEEGAQVAAGAPTMPRVVRVESDRLHYSDPERRAEFVGAVLLRSADGVLQAQRAVATMNGAGLEGKDSAGKRLRGMDVARNGTVLGGALERVVADGGVRVEQPGRVATGQQVMYTVADGLFVLTGTAAVPPVVADQATGSVTGAVLRFHTGDNRVAVEGSATPGKVGRVHTELRLKQ